MININDTLEGKVPVTRIELIELISSWGRFENFVINGYGYVPKCEPKECYNLSKLDA